MIPNENIEKLNKDIYQLVIKNIDLQEHIDVKRLKTEILKEILLKYRIENVKNLSLRSNDLQKEQIKIINQNTIDKTLVVELLYDLTCGGDLFLLPRNNSNKSFTKEISATIYFEIELHIKVSYLSNVLEIIKDKIGCSSIRLTRIFYTINNLQEICKKM